MKDFRHILFVELLGGIGDLLMALPAIHALGRSHPRAQVTVLTFAPGGELLLHNPGIHQVVLAPPGAACLALDELLAQEWFDLIVSDTNYEGIADAIQAYQARSSLCPKVVTNLWRSPPADQRISDRFLSLLFADGLIRLETIRGNQPQLHLTATERAIARQALGAAYRPLVVLCPDAGMPIKRWSPTHFITLGQALQQQYGATLVVPVGSEPEQAKAIVDGLQADGIEGMARLWQAGSLRSLAAMIAEADLAIAADTGPARIAAALEVPTITLFGPSWHGRYGQPTPHVNLQGFPDCPERNITNFTEQVCWYSGECPFEWSTCLEDLSPTAVLAAVAPFLWQLETQPIRSANLTPTHSTLTYSTPTHSTSARVDNRSTRHSNRPMSSTRGWVGGDNAAPLTHLIPFSDAAVLPWQTVRNLLVMRLDNIGDVIMTSPVLRSLQDNLPHANITLMASPGGALTQPLLPWVHDVLPWRVVWQDLGQLEFDPAREWQLVETLRQRRFDAAIILTSFSQSPHPAGLMCALAGIPLRLGESKEQGCGTLTHAVPPASDDLHQVERNLRLIESVGFQVCDRRLTLHCPVKSPLPPTTASSPYVVLTPWTSCQARNYFTDRFAIAARRLSDLTGWAIVVTGVDKDRDRAADMLAMLGDRAIDLIGKTSLPELVALIAEAKLVLTNNTSTMHIADATQTPSVILFAGTELEQQWRPRHSATRLLRRPTVCSPCYTMRCPYQLECLDISPETVVAAALDLINMESAVYPAIPDSQGVFDRSNRAIAQLPTSEKFAPICDEKR